MANDIPDRYRKLAKDWPSISVPPDIDAHDIAFRSHVPYGSYFVSGHTMWLETPAYVDAVRPLLAAEQIAASSTTKADPADKQRSDAETSAILIENPGKD